MPKKSQTENENPSAPLNFQVGSVSDIPKVVRAGRTSRYAPLYDAVSKLTGQQMISLPIKKYSQVQAFRPRLEDMGFTVSVRKSETGLVAYVKHTPKEEKEQAS